MKETTRKINFVEIHGWPVFMNVIIVHEDGVTKYFCLFSDFINIVTGKKMQRITRSIILGDIGDFKLKHAAMFLRTFS